MKQIYLQIWNLAKPYYEKGRPMDINHIEWMMKEAEIVCRKEGIDDSLLLPLVILHDMGYSEIPKGDYFKIDVRKAHMKTGAEIARKILVNLNYPREKTEKIVYYISVHDNWALNDDSVFKDPILAAFNDLDFIWGVEPKGFVIVAKLLEKSPKAMIEWIKASEKHERRPFSTSITKKLYEKYLKDREKELKGVQN